MNKKVPFLLPIVCILAISTVAIVTTEDFSLGYSETQMYEIKLDTPLSVSNNFASVKTGNNNLITFNTTAISGTGDNVIVMSTGTYFKNDTPISSIRRLDIEVLAGSLLIAYGYDEIDVEKATFTPIALPLHLDFGEGVNYFAIKSISYTSITHLGIRYECRKGERPSSTSHVPTPTSSSSSSSSKDPAKNHAKYEAKKISRYPIASLGNDVMPIIGYIGNIDSRSAHEGDPNVWNLSAQCNTAEHYEIAKAGGINIMCGRYESMMKDNGVYAIEALANAEEAGMSYFLYDTNVDKHVSSADELNSYIARYTAYKSFAGFYYLDEPHPSIYPQIGKVNVAMRNWAPGYATFVNLLPNYVPDSAIGMTYAQYVDNYCNIAKPSFLSYDHYAIGGPRGTICHQDIYFPNMQMMRRHAIEMGIPFWTFNLTSAHGMYRTPYPEDMQWQVNTSLAFGAKGISYFTYQWPPEWPSSGDGRDGQNSAMLRPNGTTTPVYEYTKKINLQVQRMDHVLMNSENISIIQKNNSPGDTGDACDKVNDSFRELKHLHTSDDLLCGCFDSNGKTVLYITNNNLTKNANFTAEFNIYCEGNLYGPTGNSTFTGTSFQYTLGPGEGLCVELTNYL